MSLECATLIVSAASVAAASLSTIVAALSYKQNADIYRETSRPYISVYCQGVVVGSEILYLVVKNFGKMQATNIVLKAVPSLSDCYAAGIGDYVDDLAGTSLAPGQSVIIALNSPKVPEHIRFEVSYSSCFGKHRDVFEGNFKSGVKSPKSVPETISQDPGQYLKYVAQSLHEILRKSL